MNRSDFQQLANERLQDALVLLNAWRWAGAYSLAGYAVECALKACIAPEAHRCELSSATPRTCGR